MLYPNRSQWTAIWLFSLAALGVWVVGGDSDGVPARLAVSLAVLGALLVWALARTGKPPATPISSAPPACCPTCSREIAHAATVCECGTLLIPEEERAKLTGVAGWLAFFVFGCAILSPLLALAFTLTALGGGGTPGDQLRILGPVLFMVGNAAIGIVAGVALARRSPNAVNTARVYLWATAIVPFGLAASMGLTVGAAAAGEWLGRTFSSIIGSIVWLRYFSRSRRILVTFGREAVSRQPSKSVLAFVAAATLAIALVPVIALKAFWPSVAGEWISHAPAGGGFVVQMPAAPKTSTESLPSEAGPVLVHRSLVEAAGDGAVFVLAYLDFGADADLTQVDPLLDNACDSEITRLKASRDVLRPVVLTAPQDGVTTPVSLGREFSAHTDGLTVKGRVFLNGRRLYILEALVPHPMTPDHLTAATRFLESFTLAPR